MESKDAAEDSHSEELVAERDDLKAQLATKSSEFLKQHRRADRLEKQVRSLQAALQAEKKKEHEEAMRLGQARAALGRLSTEAAAAVAAATDTGTDVSARETTGKRKLAVKPVLMDTSTFR